MDLNQKRTKSSSGHHPLLKPSENIPDRAGKPQQTIVVLSMFDSNADTSVAHRVAYGSYQSKIFCMILAVSQ